MRLKFPSHFLRESFDGCSKNRHDESSAYRQHYEFERVGELIQLIRLSIVLDDHNALSQRNFLSFPLCHDDPQEKGLNGSRVEKNTVVIK